MASMVLPTTTSLTFDFCPQSFIFSRGVFGSTFTGLIPYSLLIDSVCSLALALALSQ
ncbi:hypothetical protein ES703_44937 [subsurface metagenome]